MIEIRGEHRAARIDRAKKERLLDYLSEGVPNRLLARLFGVSIPNLNVQARSVRQQGMRIRTSRGAGFGKGVLLELHDRLANKWARDDWDNDLYRIVCDEIWTKIVLPAFPFEKYAEILKVLTSPEDPGPYEKLTKAICGGFHSAERDIQHLVRNELFEILGQRKEGSECAPQGLLKVLKTRVGRRLRLGAINARELTSLDRELVNRVLESLPAREEQIVRLRFGLSGDPSTLAQIGELTGLSRSRIGQLEHRAIRRLRHPSRSRQLEHLFSVETILKRLEARVAELIAERDELRRVVEILQRNPLHDTALTDGEGGSKPEVMNTQIGDLELSVRAYNCLKHLQVQTVGDILRYSKADLLRVKNAGRKTVTEIEEILASMGVSLAKNWGRL